METDSDWSGNKGKKDIGERKVEMIRLLVSTLALSQKEAFRVSCIQTLKTCQKLEGDTKIVQSPTSYVPN